MNFNNGNFTNKIKKLSKVIKEADAIVLGAGAGLSTSAGFTYDGERFDKYFSDFKEKYGFTDMYTGGFYPYETSEEFWAYWSRYIYVNRYMDIPTDLYQRLFSLISDKNYFVITTNVDHCFQRSGFDLDRLFFTQGDYGLFQCSKPCCKETFENKELVEKMVSYQANMMIPSSLIPHCPHCNREMTMNLRSDNTFVEDKAWYQNAHKYQEFLNRFCKNNVLYLELGVGYNTPGIIKYPFWQMTARNPNAYYASINNGQAYAPEEIRSQSILINDDISKAVDSLLERK